MYFPWNIAWLRAHTGSFPLRWLYCHLVNAKLHTGRCNSKFHVGGRGRGVRGEITLPVHTKHANGGGGSRHARTFFNISCIQNVTTVASRKPRSELQQNFCCFKLCNRSQCSAVIYRPTTWKLPTLWKIIINLTPSSCLKNANVEHNY